MSHPVLGCIADDFTGGTDLAGMLVKNGMRTVLMIGVPRDPLPPDTDAVVIALKSRTAPVDEAISESVGALHWLQQVGCRQYYFKYCSTFDSTAEGNIGPVAEALMTNLGTDFTIACPAFPANKRTIYKGHLFVGDARLDESGMRNHPLTPMTDSNLIRVLQRQTRGKVGLVDYEVVRQGAAAIRERFLRLKAEGISFAVVDAIGDEDLTSIGAACSDMLLVTAGSGIAMGLPRNFPELAKTSAVGAATLPPSTGYRAVVAGSCSAATLGQVAAMRAKHPSFRVDPLDLARGDDVVGAALAWAAPILKDGPVLVYASASPDEVKATQAAIGGVRAGALVEKGLAEIAKRLVELGVGRLIVAGGETAGSVVNLLGVRGLRIGPEIDPGVPWTAALGSVERSLSLALKSGNFGSPDFFVKAWDLLP